LFSGQKGPPKTMDRKKESAMICNAGGSETCSVTGTR
jgi:hypothetical protein